MFLFLISAFALSPVESVKQRTVDVDFLDLSPNLSIAYRGGGSLGLQPGLSARLDGSVIRRDIHVENTRGRRGFRHRTRDVFAAVDLGVNAQVFNNTMVQLRGIIGNQITRTSGYTTSPTLGIGLNRAILMHPAWKVDEDGEAHRRYLQGQWSAVVSFGYSVGFDLQRRRETRINKGKSDRKELAGTTHLYIRPTVMLLIPWIDLSAPMANLEIGLRKPLSTWRGKK